MSSAYRQAIIPLIQKHSVAYIDKSVWRKLWGLISKVKVFLWKACREILPARTALRRRGMNITPECPRCDEQSESAVHAVGQCPAIRPIWDNGPQCTPTMGNFASFAELFTYLCGTKAVDVICSYAYLLWMCWNSRNAVVFEKPSISVEEIVRQGSHLALEFRSAQTTQQDQGPAPPIPRIYVKWKPPPDQWVKLNVDAAILGSEKRVGVGAVIRDSSGRILHALTASIQGEYSAFYAEALAMRYSIGWALQFQFRI